MSVTDYISHLNIEVKRQEGENLVCVCLFCGSSKLYIHETTGAWHCFTCDEKGHPYQLAKKVLPDLQPKAIFELLSRFGLKSDNNGQNKTHHVAPGQAKPMLADQDITDLSDAEVDTFCQAKTLDKACLLSLNPRRHGEHPWVLIPAYDPKAMAKPCGWIRAGIDGSKIPIKCKDDDGNWIYKDEKYPLVAGSKPGLVGLHKIAKDNPETIILTEGFKAKLAVQSLGYASLCKSHGVKSWSDTWIDVFAGKRVIIMFDRDAAGNGGPRTVTMPDGSTKVNQCKQTDMEQAKLIRTVAKEVRIVRLPYEYRETNGLDPWDWIVTDGHTREDLDRLINTTPVFAPDPEPVELPDNNVVLDDDMPDTIAIAFEAWQKKQGIIHRYNPTDGWTIYKDGKYQTVDAKSQVMRYLSQFVRNCWFQRGKKTERIGLSSKKLNDVLTQLSFLDDVYLRPKQCSPCSLDGSLDPNNIIAVNNGLLDLKTKPFELLSFRPEYYTIQYLPYDWKGEVKPDMWMNFLVDATDGDIEVCQLLQQWAGYCLMKNTQPQRKFLLIQGESGTGKSVFVDVLSAMLGTENVSAVPLEMFDDMHVLTQTYGKLLNVSDESEDMILDPSIENILKHYTGGTSMTFKRLFQNPITALPTAKIMICTNHLPKFKDTSEGVWNRCILVRFNCVVPEEKKDIFLAKKIKETELSGVLGWALEGLRMLVHYERFIEPSSLKLAMIEYKREMFPELCFFEDHIEESSCDETSATCKEVREAYEKFCKSGNYGVKNDTNFGKAVKKKFPRSERKKIRKGGTRCWIYSGIKIKTDSEYLNCCGENE